MLLFYGNEIFKTIAYQSNKVRISSNVNVKSCCRFTVQLVRYHIVHYYNANMHGSLENKRTLKKNCQLSNQSPCHLPFVAVCLTMFCCCCCCFELTFELSRCIRLFFFFICLLCRRYVPFNMN